MELAEAIFYRKINPSDFKKIYDIDIPIGGGGQTYIEAAGIPDAILEAFLKYGDQLPSSLSAETRSVYIIKAYVLGSTEIANIEFAPRRGRNYRISRQNKKYKHPAWKISNGFPEPKKFPNGSYDRNFVGIIDDLIIYIIRTNKNCYYAVFMNSPNIPANWPSGIGLEQMTHDDRRGVLFLDKHNVGFLNDAYCPFSIISAIDEQIDINDLPENICIDVADASEYSHKPIVINIDYSSVGINEVTPPKGAVVGRSISQKSARRARKKDYVKDQKNKKIIGDAGEKLVVEIEKRRLQLLGRSDLADKIEWVSNEQGDGLGYDILSYDIQGDTGVPIFIEVKTTTAGINKPFDVSINEVNFSEENKHAFYIYRVFELTDKSSEISYYRVKGSIKDKFDLAPTAFFATPKA